MRPGVMPIDPPPVEAARPHPRAADMAALAGEGFDDQQIADWFRPLGVALTADEVGDILAQNHLR